MKIRITTLSENTAGIGFLAEWGLSVLVETDKVNVLLDTGQSISVTYNADALGVDLSRIDKIVLSHGHYDHTGGLRSVLRRMRKEVEVIAHPDIWAAKYSCGYGRKDRYIGIPFQRQELESLGARFSLTGEPVRISDDIMTTGEISMETDFEKMNSGLCVKKGDGFRPDELRDDQALIITTDKGLVVILGCAHRGIINTLYRAQALTGVKRIDTVIGGCHLFDASEERVWRTISALKELDVSRIGASHCTGLPVAALMAQEFGDRFFFNTAGTRIELALRS